MRSTIDKAGRLVIPAAIRDKAGLAPGTTIEISLEETGVRLERVAAGPRLVRVGKRLVARPTVAADDSSEDRRGRADRGRTEPMAVGPFLDTSVLLAGLVDFGPQSAPAQEVLHAVAEGKAGRAGTAWHCCLEFFSVATRLPAKFRLISCRRRLAGSRRGLRPDDGARPAAEAQRTFLQTARPGGHHRRPRLRRAHRRGGAIGRRDRDRHRQPSPLPLRVAATASASTRRPSSWRR